MRAHLSVWLVAMRFIGPSICTAGDVQSPLHEFRDSSALTSAQVSSSSASSTADRIAAGALLGAIAGAILVSTVGQESCLNQSRSVCAVQGGVSFGIAGGLLGWLMGRKHP